MPVVFATTSDINSSSPDLGDSADPASAVVSESTSGVPIAVVVAAITLASAAAVAVVWWSGRAVRPMKSITQLADEIQGASLDRRIGLQGAAAEVQALADSFDRMLDRLATASALQQRLMAMAAAASVSPS